MSFEYIQQLIKKIIYFVYSLQEINSKLNEKLTNHIEKLEQNRLKQITQNAFVQTDAVPDNEFDQKRSVGSQTDNKFSSGIKPPSASSNNSSNKKQVKLSNSYSESTLSQHVTAPAKDKDDAHLMATLRGMRIDLAIKEKAMQRLTRDVDESKKTIRKLQKERDGYLKNEKGSISVQPSPTTPGTRKPYDPSQFSEGGNNDNNVAALREALCKITLLEADYKMLHEKRVQDVCIYFLI